MSLSLAVKNAARLEELRDTYKTIRGDKWPSVVAEYRPFIEDRMKADKCDVLPAAISICKELRAKGLETGEILAVACEMIKA